MSDLRYAAQPATHTDVPRPGAVRASGVRLHRAAEQERAVQRTTTRSTSRPGSSTSTRSAASPPSTRPTCAAVPVAGALHPAGAGLLRRQDRHARGGRARRRVLHDAGPLGRALLSAEAVRTLGTIGQEFARDTADVNDRENIQYHWIRIEDVPEIWSRLEAVGLTTLEACGDSPRPFLGSPVAGVAEDEIIDGSDALAEIKRRILGNPAYSNLPRKFKTAVTGHPSHDVSPRPTTSPSSAPSTPSTAPASTCGSAAGCRPTRCSPRSSASGSRSTRSPTPGRASPGSSATTATAGSARGPG